MRDRTRNLLSHLVTLYPSVIISGRARTSVLDKLRGVRAARAIGNHRAETEVTSKKSGRQVKRWKAVLELELSGLPGLWVEDKGLSLAVALSAIPPKKQCASANPRNSVVSAHLGPGRVPGNAQGPCFSRQVSIYLAKRVGRAVEKIERLRRTDEAVDALVDVLTAALSPESTCETPKPEPPSRSLLIEAVASRVIDRLTELRLDKNVRCDIAVHVDYPARGGQHFSRPK